MSSIVIKDIENNFYKIDTKQLYVPTETKEYKENFDIRISKIKKKERGRSLEVHYRVKNFFYYVKVNMESMRFKFSHMFGTEEINLIEQYINEKGLRIKTRKGFIFSVSCYLDKGKYVFKRDTCRMRSNFEKSRDKRHIHLRLSNIYTTRHVGDADQGRICWGDLNNNKAGGINKGTEFLFEFFDSEFNADLEKDFTVTNKFAKKIENYDNTYTGIQGMLVELLKRKIRDFKGREVGLMGDLLLLLISSVFDFDNMELESLV